MFCGSKLDCFIFANFTGMTEEADGQQSQGSFECLCGEINSLCKRLADIPAELNLGQTANKLVKMWRILKKEREF